MTQTDQPTSFKEAGAAIQKAQDAILDTILGDEMVTLRGGQLRLKQRLGKLKKLREELNDEFQKWSPVLDRRQISLDKWHAAQARSSELLRHLGSARRSFEEHLKLFTPEMDLDRVGEWSAENERLVRMVEAFSDLWKRQEAVVQHALIEAQDAAREPDPALVLTLRKISTLKSRYESLNWNEQAYGEGVEILAELKELHKSLNFIVEH